MAEKQVISRQRVIDHGEVLTAEREVNAMIDLVAHEADRIDSRFLEPACGTGNFLLEILRRKLSKVQERYSKNETDFEYYSFIATSSIYGIDILNDNVTRCIERLLGVVNEFYNKSFKRNCSPCLEKIFKFVLEKNIIWADALTLKHLDDTGIVFSEWSPLDNGLVKRRDFIYDDMVARSAIEDLTLDYYLQKESDEYVALDPVNDFPVIHFMRICDAE